MFFQTWSDFFNMGGYGFYVWLSYAVSLVAVIALIVQSVKQRKTVLQSCVRNNAKNVYNKQIRGIHYESKT